MHAPSTRIIHCLYAKPVQRGTISVDKAAYIAIWMRFVTKRMQIEM